MKNTVTISGGGYTASFRTDKGGNCVQLLHVPSGANILRTPPNEEKFTENANVYGMPLLFPPNRVRDGEYTFQGREYHFPINEPARNHHIHGVLSISEFEVSELKEDYVRFTYRATKEKPYLEFPHQFTVSLEYSVSEAGLFQRLTVSNDGEWDMPFGAGFHTAINVPFMPEGDGDACILRVTAGKEWLYDERIMPTGETKDAAKFVKGVPAAHTVISNLMDMGGSGGTAIVEDKTAGGRVIYEVGKGYRYWMLFNQGGENGFVCPEPQTWTVDAPHSPLPPEISGFDAIRPGDKRVLEARMRFEKI